MIEGRSFICFCNDWSGDPLSKKQIVTRLAAHNRILWVNSTGNRNPTFSAYDFRRALRKLADGLRGCRPVADNIWLFHPLVIPFHGNRLARAVNRRLLRWSLRRACGKLGFDQPITLSFLPTSADVAGHLGESKVIYYCVDEYSRFSGTDAAGILEMEGRLMRAAQLVVVSSTRLLETKRPYNDNTVLIPHGVDVSHFRKACLAETAVPPDMPSRGRVIGFFGLIADWVDVDVFRHLAASRPDWDIVLIGDVRTDVSALDGLPNVHLLGRRPYESLPAYSKGFDVAILPFISNELTLAANPLKLREYLAAGLPVVATPLPEVRRMGDCVATAATPDEFLGEIERLIEAGRCGPDLEASHAVDPESWDHKVEQLSALIDGSDRAERSEPAPAQTGFASFYCLVIGLLFVVAFRVVTFPAGVATVEWWVENPLTKVRPRDPVPEKQVSTVRIYAARNEFEPFQLVLRAGGDEISGIDIQCSDFRSVGGARIDAKNVTIYREGFVDLHSPSSVEGGTGRWPDPLIPRVDRYYGERRNAFPLSLERNRNQPVWVDVFVPEDTPPGRYDATVRITRDGRPVAAVPVRLTVWGFELPSTSTLRSSFGLNGINLVKAHHGRYTNDTELHHLTRLYATAALEHRISIHGGTMVPPKADYRDGKAVIDWSTYDGEMGPLLDATAIPVGQPLHGARASSVELRTPSSFPSGEAQKAYLRAWTEHFREKGWLDRLFLYLWDEPTPKDYPALVQRGALAGRAAPDVPTMVTTSFSDKIASAVTIWAPVINCLDDKPGPEDYCEGESRPPDFYGTTPTDRRKHLWFYQSCASHGCNIGGEGYFQGWPRYVIDAPGTANRVMQWLAWQFGVDGELYYSMNEAFGDDASPWSDTRRFGGNGDGTLFYPGLPSRIGGHTDIPIESIRLKLIREGMEDYEYLALLAKWKGRPAASRYARRIAQRAYIWEGDADKFLDVRRSLGDELDRLAERRANSGSHAD